MVFIRRDQLTITEISAYEDVISFDKLAEIILYRPSNIIYCECKGKLYGIISSGDIIRASKKGNDFVAVNQNFTWVSNNEYMRARTIFHEKRSTTLDEIPVLNSNHELIGNYSRWDTDLLFRIKFRSLEAELLQKYYKNVTVVRPSTISEEKRYNFENFKNYLKLKGVDFLCIEKNDAGDYFDRVEEIWFADHAERRAISVLYKYIWHKDTGKTKCRVYKDFFSVGMNRVITKGYLQNVKKKGVHLLNLTVDFDAEKDNYFKALVEEMEHRFLAVGKVLSPVLPEDLYEEFFDDLYSENYAESVAQINFLIETRSGCAKLRDCHNEYYNVTDGERFTYGQPEEYSNTIYFLGPCFIEGHYAADRYTIESFLQRRLNEAGYKIKVVNYGSPSQIDNFRDNNNIFLAANIESLPLREGDVLVYACSSVDDGIEGCLKLNLAEICKVHHAPAKWMIDFPAHCNHRIYSMFADAIYDLLTPLFAKSLDKKGGLLEKTGNFIKINYLDQYFGDFQPFMYHNIGAIVMNCNPFTYGHRYLIERALNTVDFLIIFAVEEDESLFSFEERFSMICDGVADLENVMVVPSGPFILSKTTFPEYFIKEKDEDIIQNVENDIRFFGERIAPQLNIGYRFVGEEPEDGVTNEYNCAMKRILPEYSIELVEVPRKKINDSYISASLVRKCLEKLDMKKLEKLVPESTRKILFREN